MNAGLSFPNFDELAANLGQVEHFKGLPSRELEEIIRSGSIRRYAREQVIFVEEERGSRLCVLLSGRVQICKLSRQGQIAILAVVEAVMMFNEVAAIDGGANPATAIALEDSLVWQLDPVRLEEMVLRYPRVGLGLLRVMAQRNRRLVGQYQDLSFRSVLARTAKLLLELSAEGKQPIDRRKHPNHQLAARIATGPEAFSRSLKVFKMSGDIRCSEHKIEVYDPTQLRNVAQVNFYET